MVLGQEVCELLEGRLLEHSLLPEVWCEVGVCRCDGSISSLGEVAECSSRSSGTGVAIINSSHLQEFLWYRSRHDASTAGGWDQAHPDRPTFTSNLAGHGVGSADLVTPEPSPHGHDGQLGQDDGSTDSSGNLLGALHTQPNVAVIVANS